MHLATIIPASRVSGGLRVSRAMAAEENPIRARWVRLGTLPGGGVSERPKEHASKACKARAFEGSNPSATATPPPRRDQRTVAVGVDVRG